jgi:hypothetical protein
MAHNADTAAGQAMQQAVAAVAITANVHADALAVVGGVSMRTHCPTAVEHSVGCFACIPAIQVAGPDPGIQVS